MIVAAGMGKRFGATVAKQYQHIHLPHMQTELEPRTVLEHSVRQLAKSQYINECYLVIAANDTKAAELNWDIPVHFVTGGSERWQSVQAGVQAIAEAGATATDLVLIHDAARPCIQAADINRVVEVAVNEAYGAILATPVADTLKQAKPQVSIPCIAQTISREHLWQAQTPQVFRFGHLQRVLTDIAAKNMMITDEASAFELFGYPIRLVAGSRSNIKLTYPEDLPLISAILAMA